LHTQHTQFLAARVASLLKIAVLWRAEQMEVQSRHMTVIQMELHYQAMTLAYRLA